MGMPIDEALATLLAQDPYRDFVTHVEHVEPRRAVPGALRTPLPPVFQEYLDERDWHLHRHQATVVDTLRQGHHVMVTTSTASGKTLGFNLPILERLAADAQATALYVYPTKALAQDQWKNLQGLTDALNLNVSAAIYDGDTPNAQRSRIRTTSRVILTNFYMLHQVLAWAHQWDRFWSHLAFVVIDEAHMYRGVFGSNVALLIRRLRRLLALYGVHPQFVMASATLANPTEFGTELTGVTPVLVDQDGSGHGAQSIVIYNPEALGPGGASPHQETARIVAANVAAGVPTLAFTVSRHMAELVTQWTRDFLRDSAPALVDRVAPYRAGYLPRERRDLEAALRSGIIRGMVSTNALEVGIDIGHLDAVVMSGFPGTMISARQQMGRAGRSDQPSMVVWVPFANPLDQYLARHPAMFFRRPHERATVDVANPYILAGHLLCATAERPLRAPEIEQYFGPSALALLASLGEQDLVRETPRGWVYQSHPAPSQIVSLTGIGTRPVVKVLIDGEHLLETIDWAKALEEAHPGAVLLHQAESYVVSALDLDRQVAIVTKQTVDYWTDPIKMVDIRVVAERRTRAWGRGRLVWGEVEVTEHVVGYKIRKFDQVVGHQVLSLPPVTYKTMGLWFVMADDMVASLAPRSEVAGGLHAAEHAMIGMMPLHVLCDRWDLGGVSTPVHPDTLAPTIFVYEGVEGGIGLTEKGYLLAHDIIRTTKELLRDCPCEEGCPSCVLSPKCGNDNNPINKRVALALLQILDSVDEGARPVPSGQ